MHNLVPNSRTFAEDVSFRELPVNCHDCGKFWRPTVSLLQIDEKRPTGGLNLKGN